MGECPCGFRYRITDEYSTHLADVVIRELGMYRMASGQWGTDVELTVAEVFGPE